MKVEVWKEDPKEVEQPLRLKLITGCGEIILVVVNEAGGVATQGNLLSIDNDGRVTRSSNINPGFGLRLDDFGRLEITK